VYSRAALARRYDLIHELSEGVAAGSKMLQEYFYDCTGSFIAFLVAGSLQTIYILVSPYSLMGVCNNMENAIFR
jgi:hypothetical protein